jgi:hypothetical protein
MFPSYYHSFESSKFKRNRVEHFLRAEKYLRYPSYLRHAYYKGLRICHLKPEFELDKRLKLIRESEIILREIKLVAVVESIDIAYARAD